MCYIVSVLNITKWSSLFAVLHGSCTEHKFNMSLRESCSEFHFPDKTVRSFSVFAPEILDLKISKKATLGYQKHGLG